MTELNSDLPPVELVLAESGEMLPPADGFTVIPTAGTYGWAAPLVSDDTAPAGGFTWNHRVVEFGGSLAIFEVSYDHSGTITGMPEWPSSPLGNDLDELRWEAERFVEACKHPVIPEAVWASFWGEEVCLRQRLTDAEADFNRIVDSGASFTKCNAAAGEYNAALKALETFLENAVTEADEEAGAVVTAVQDAYEADGFETDPEGVAMQAALDKCWAAEKALAEFRAERGIKNPDRPADRDDDDDSGFSGTCPTCGQQDHREKA